MVAGSVRANMELARFHRPAPAIRETPPGHVTGRWVAPYWMDERKLKKKEFWLKVCLRFWLFEAHQLARPLTHSPSVRLLVVVARPPA